MHKLTAVLMLFLAGAAAQGAKTPKVPKPPKAEPVLSAHQMEKRRFEAVNPCPSTGRGGQCPGYVVGYIRPIECGGADMAMNMRWLTTEAEKAVRKALKKTGCGQTPV